MPCPGVSGLGVRIPLKGSLGVPLGIHKEFGVQGLGVKGFRGLGFRGSGVQGFRGLGV